MSRTVDYPAKGTVIVPENTHEANVEAMLIGDPAFGPWWDCLIENRDTGERDIVDVAADNRKHALERAVERARAFFGWEHPRVLSAARYTEDF